MVAVCSWEPKWCSSAVVQLQIDAVMKNAVKVVDTDKFSGIYVICFHSLISEPFTEVWQLHLTIK